MLYAAIHFQWAQREVHGLNTDDREVDAAGHAWHFAQWNTDTSPSTGHAKEIAVRWGLLWHEANYAQAEQRAGQAMTDSAPKLDRAIRFNADEDDHWWWKAVTVDTEAYQLKAPLFSSYPQSCCRTRVAYANAMDTLLLLYAVAGERAVALAEQHFDD